MSTIADDAEKWVKAAAGESAGLTIGRQLRNACRALGYSDGNWRVRAAWYGEASCWSARAFEDLRTRYATWSDRQERLAQEADKTHAALLRATARTSQGDNHATLDRQDTQRMVSHADEIVQHRSRHQTD